MTQKELFFQIWSERDHCCSVCDEYLGEEPMAYFFAHILSKGAYPKFKLEPCNIELLCLDCHQKWDFGGIDGDFNDLISKEQELKEKYFQNS